MAKVKARENRSTELAFVSLLKRNRITGWRRRSTLYGSPDFVFKKQRIVVFVDGDFWHGHPVNLRLPSSNKKYWTEKIERNRRRDKIVNRALRSEGWKVLRFWESQLSKKGQLIVTKLRKVLESRATRHRRPEVDGYLGGKNIRR